MNSKLTLLKIVGFLNLATALIHTFGGQVELVNPILESTLLPSIQAQWIGVWHMVTVILFATSYLYLKEAFKKESHPNYSLIILISQLNLLFALVFIGAWLSQDTFTGQWVLFTPIGVLGWLSALNHKTTV